MTLEKTWKECLRMWKWIAEEEIYIIDDSNVDDLKRIWLSLNGYGDIRKYCFFCEYAEKHGGNSDCGDCEGCPAQGVDKNFNCQVYGVHWRDNPIEFYNRLVKLNKKRLSKKGKRCM